VELALGAIDRFAEERVANGFSGGLPAFNSLVDDYGRVGDGDPEADFFDGKFAPMR